ncbi:MAG TPA: hypothetical protein VMD74_05655 [Candidatus Methylomirabilis sp.]|nr:hypothetical protein [Candidatus Methylomirabilis sp.]
MKIFLKKFGFATIPTILAVSALILIAATGIAAITYTQNSTSVVERRSETAWRYAEAGAQDALMRIARNKNYSCVTVDCYSLDLADNGCANGAGCATVSVSAGTGTAGDPKVITAKGIVQNNTREVEAQVIFDAAGNGEISSVVWQELTN